jgi:hypothetical protein
MPSQNDFRNFDVAAHQAGVRAGRRSRQHSVDCFCYRCTPQGTPPDKPAKPKRARNLAITEHEHQCAVIKWKDDQAMLGLLPGVHLLFAIPNGGKRGKGEAGRFRAEGVKPGVADLFLPVARGQWHGLFVEMKSEKGKLSELQNDFLADVDDQGYMTAVCFSAADAILVIENYYGVK